MLLGKIKGKRIGSLILLGLFLFISSTYADDKAQVKNPKYIFLMIGDGMGENLRKATDIYLKSSKEGKKALVMESFPVRGLTRTKSLSGVTDSAAAGTALSCGKKTRNGILGLTEDGKVLESVAELAKRKGLKVGIISDAPINHATPAAFYAHVDSRNKYSEISAFIPKSRFDFFSGGKFLKSKGKKAPDEILKSAGYRIIRKVEDFNAFAYNIPYAIDEKGKKKITLAKILEKAIKNLDNPQGFFIMLEGGKIDWSCHNNDIATAIKNVAAFDNAIEVAYKFYMQDPDNTLIVVTADHETGGLKLGNTANLRESIDSQQCSKMSFMKDVNTLKKKNGTFEEFKKLVENNFGLKKLNGEETEALRHAYNAFMDKTSKDSRPEEIKKMYGSGNPVIYACSEILSKRAGIKWSSGGHTTKKVTTTAIGAGAEKFKGEKDNTDTAKILKDFMPENAESK
jgi:alkaline phosphatase